MDGGPTRIAISAVGMGHFCRICKRERPNERFSGRGWRTHVCKECQGLPKEERAAIESEDEIVGYLGQSNISKGNLRRLRKLCASENARISFLAGLVLELGEFHPRRKQRFKALARGNRDLLRRLEAAHLTLWM